MTIYNKLIRDKIPEVINCNGMEAKFVILSDDEFYRALVNKLLEEVNEFIESDNLEEIADVLEVIDAILVSR